MRFLSALVLSAALVGPPAGAEASLSREGREAIADARAGLQAAMNTGSVDDMLSARAGLLALDEKEQADPAVRYTILLADWRVAPLLARAKKPVEEVQKYVDEGLAQALALEKATPKDPEPYALHSSLLGLKMMSANADVMTLGPQSMVLMQKAVKLGPANPRVQMLSGMQTLFTPAQFGGGAQPALPILTQAVTLFESDKPSGALAPAWGADDASVWLAQAQIALGDTTAARASLDKALAINPYHGFARMLQAQAGGEQK